MAFSSLIKDHKRRRQESIRVQETRKHEAVGAVEGLTTLLLDEVNSGVAQVYVTEHKIQQEATRLQQQAVEFSDRSKKWTKAFRDFDKALLELGDVEDWAHSIGRQLDQVESALHYVVSGHQANAESKSAAALVAQAASGRAPAVAAAASTSAAGSAGGGGGAAAAAPGATGASAAPAAARSTGSASKGSVGSASERSTSGDSFGEPAAAASVDPDAVVRPGSFSASRKRKKSKRKDVALIEDPFGPR